MNVHFGRTTVTGTGNFSVGSIPFEPKFVEVMAAAKTDTNDNDQARFSLGWSDFTSTECQSHLANANGFWTRMSNTRIVKLYATPGGTLSVALSISCTGKTETTPGVWQVNFSCDVCATSMPAIIKITG